MRVVHQVLRALVIGGLVILAWVMVTRIVHEFDGYVILREERSKQKIQPVTDLRVGIQPEAIVVGWTDPSDRLLGHIYVQWTDESGSTTSRRVDPGVEMTLIRGLLPGTTYKLRVTAMNTKSAISDAARVRVEMPEADRWVDGGS